METQTVKLTKRQGTTPQAEQLDTSPSTNLYEALKANGIPIRKAVFKTTVRFWSGSPENAYYAPSSDAKNPPKPHRTANMWLCPGGILICEHAKGEKLMVSPGNWLDAIPL
jgi:hypothetical protein